MVTGLCPECRGGPSDAVILLLLAAMVMRKQNGRAQRLALVVI
jgi:hypothetical protein